MRPAPDEPYSFTDGELIVASAWLAFYLMVLAGSLAQAVGPAARSLAALVDGA